MELLHPIFKWLHIIAGITWIGLLYFFNFINGHVAATMDGDTKKKVVSVADLIVLGGSTAIEKAAKKAGHKINVPFIPGREDASQDKTDTYSGKYQWRSGLIQI